MLDVVDGYEGMQLVSVVLVRYQQGSLWVHVGRIKVVHRQPGGHRHHVKRTSLCHSI